MPCCPFHEREGGEHGVEVALAALVGVAHGAGTRVRAVPRVQRLDLAPHPALVGAVAGARAQGDVAAVLHRVAHLALGDDVALGELPRRVGPAALLGAAHGDDQAAVLADQDARVEHAVLLGAAQFLAVQHEDARVALVDHAQLGHRAALADLGDDGALPGEGLAQRDVARPGPALVAVAVQMQREHRQRSVDLAVPDAQRLHQCRACECLLALGHVPPPSRRPLAGPARPANGTLLFVTPASRGASSPSRPPTSLMIRNHQHHGLYSTNMMLL